MKAYKDNREHYYLKADGHILHINDECNLINTLDSDALDDEVTEFIDGTVRYHYQIEEIPEEEFRARLHQAVANLELGIYF